MYRDLCFFLQINDIMHEQMAVSGSHLESGLTVPASCRKLEGEEGMEVHYVQKGTRTFHRINLALFIGGFVTFANLYSTQPLLPIFSREFHISPTVASLSLSVTTVALAVFMLVAGSLSESFGRKPMMTVGMVGTSLLALLIPFSPNFGMLIMLRIIEGIMLAGLPAIAMAYLSEEVDIKSLGVAMGLYISGNSVGGMAGRIIIGMLTSWISWRFAIGTIGVLSLFCSAIFVWALPASRNFVKRPLMLTTLFSSLIHHLHDRGLVYLFLIGFMLMGSFVTLFNYIGYRLMGAPYHLSQGVVGWIFIIYLTGTFSSTWMGRLADRFGRRKVQWIAILIMLCGTLLTDFWSLWLVIIGIGIFTFGFFGAHSLASSWVGRRAVSEKAQASSLYLFFYYGGSSIGGTSGGELWSAFSWGGIVAMISMMLLVAFLLTQRLSALYRQEETVQTGIQ